MKLWATSYGTPVCTYIVTPVTISTGILLSGNGSSWTHCTVRICILASEPDRGKTMSSRGEMDAFKVSPSKYLLVAD